MRSNSRPYRRLLLVRNSLTAFAVIAIAYRGVRNADSLHDTWTFAAAFVLVAVTIATWVRVHVLKEREAEERSWWSGPLPAFIQSDDPVVVPIATRRSRPGGGTQKAG